MKQSVEFVTWSEAWPADGLVYWRQGQGNKSLKLNKPAEGFEDVAALLAQYGIWLRFVRPVGSSGLNEYVFERVVQVDEQGNTKEDSLELLLGEAE